MGPNTQISDDIYIRLSVISLIPIFLNKPSNVCSEPMQLSLRDTMPLRMLSVLTLPKLLPFRWV